MQQRRGFTLVELLVVIGIIALLIGILIPVVGKVRANAYVADSKNWISQLSGAIERYHTDFHAYPGPIDNRNVYDAGFTQGATYPTAPVSAGAVSGFDTTIDPTKITGPENLTLGLLGGLNLSGAGVVYNPSQVGLGPMNLNVANPKRFPPYLDATNLSWTTNATGKTGKFLDDAGAATDSNIPEFVDRFPNPLPILYLRSRLGVAPIVAPPPLTAQNNSVITYTPGFNSTSMTHVGAYDLGQIIAYTGQSIGIGKEVKSSEYVNATSPQHGLTSVIPTRVLDKGNTANYQYPYDAFPYFQSPSTANVARQSDGYILISPGRDRTYGTNDDICSFGDVNP